jgi:hypothetical protein
MLVRAVSSALRVRSGKIHSSRLLEFLASSIARLGGEGKARRFC